MKTIFLILILSTTLNAQVSNIKREYDEFTGITTWSGDWHKVAHSNPNIRSVTMASYLYKNPSDKTVFVSIVIDVIATDLKYRIDKAHALIGQNATRKSFDMFEAFFEPETLQNYSEQRLVVIIETKLQKPTRIRIGQDVYALSDNMIEELNHLWILR